MGCGGSYIQRQPDVLVQGTGVEPIHCYIETTLSLNKSLQPGGSCGGAGMSVVLYPLGEMTSVDGTRINSPVKLTQGNYFFFRKLIRNRFLKKKKEKNFKLKFF